MELAGLKKALIFLDSHGVTVELLVTDRHVQAKAFMRKEMPHIVHEFDVWHVGKGAISFFIAYVHLYRNVAHITDFYKLHNFCSSFFKSILASF